MKNHAISLSLFLMCNALAMEQQTITYDGIAYECHQIADGYLFKPAKGKGHSYTLKIKPDGSPIINSTATAMVTVDIKSLETATEAKARGEAFFAFLKTILKKKHRL